MLAEFNAYVSACRKFHSVCSVKAVAGKVGLPLATRFWFFLLLFYLFSQKYMKIYDTFPLKINSPKLLELSKSIDNIFKTFNLRPFYKLNRQLSLYRSHTAYSVKSAEHPKRIWLVLSQSLRCAKGSITFICKFVWIKNSQQFRIKWKLQFLN